MDGQMYINIKNVSKDKSQFILSLTDATQSYVTFQEIYTEYSTLVYNLALQYAQNNEDAEEITQDVFVSVHQSLHGFQQNSELKTWIYRITINKSLDFLKAKKRKKRFSFILSLLSDEVKSQNSTQHNFDHPGVILEQKEALENLFHHINSLPDNQKTVVILSKVEQKSTKEIAEILGLSPKAIESLFQRAKKNLTKMMGQSEGL